MLLEAELIDKFQLESGLSFQRNVGGRIGSALVKLGYIAEETILQFLDNQDNIVRVDLKTLKIPPDAYTAIPMTKLFENMIVPVEWQPQGKNRTLVVAMTDPTNLKLIDDLRFMVGCPIQAVVASEADIESALNRHFPAGRPHPAARPARNPLVDELAALSAAKVAKVDQVEARLERLIALLLRKGLLNERDIDSLK
jgi:type IV pilus assembly protein PilB